MDYIRIGTDYYKKSSMPLLSGDTCNVLLKWRKSEIIQDEGSSQQTNNTNNQSVEPSITNV